MKNSIVKNIGAFALMAGLAAAEPVKVCVAPPDVRMSGVNGGASDSVRETLAGYLTGPSIQPVKMTARLASQVSEESRQAGCSALLFITITQKRGGGPGFLNRTLSNAGYSAAGYIPGGGSVATGVARSVAMSGVYTAAQLATATKAKDEFRLEYRLERAAGSGSTANGDCHARAQSDGEDVLTPLIGKAAEEIVPFVRKAGK